MKREILHSEACERNKEVILKNLKDFIPKDKVINLLEIGFGTGQHAHYFSEMLPHINFTIADVEDYHLAFKERLKHFGDRDNIEGPFLFEASEKEIRHNLPRESYDIIYCANVFHIMSWPEVNQTLLALSSLLNKEGFLLFYGPFKFREKFTSHSNQSFDSSLKTRNPKMGIRDSEKIESILSESQISLYDRRDLPANNNFLIFKR